VVAIIFVFIATIILAFLNYYLFPKFSEEAKSAVLLISTVFFLALLVLSEFFQIAGVSIKDLFWKSGEIQENDDETKRLINEIEQTLYGANESLPKVLVLCLSLCAVTGLSSDYSVWLKYELEGFPSLDGIKAQHKDDEEFEKWVEKWLNHRLREIYAKFQHTSSETGISQIDAIPLRKFMVGFPVAKIADTIHDAKEKGFQEIFYNLYDLDREAFNELNKFVAKPPLQTTLPYDLRAFLSISDFEDILNKVRSKVVELISEVRRHNE